MQAIAMGLGMFSPILILVFIGKVISYFLGEKDDNDE